MVYGQMGGQERAGWDACDPKACLSYSRLRCMISPIITYLLTKI